MTRGRHGWLLMAVAIMLLSAACGGEGASGDEVTSIRVGISPDPAYAPYVIAQEEGFFEDHGLEAEIRRFSAGGDMNDAVIADEIDFAGSGTGTLLPRLATGREKIFAVTATSGTTFGIAADTALQSPEDFRGKQLGMVPGTTSEYVWKFFLDTHGIAADEVEMVGAAPPELVSAIDGGDIDAFIVWEPWPTQAVRTAGEENVHIFGRNEDVGYMLYFSFAGNTEFMEANPDVTVRVLRAVQDAIDFINSNPDETVEIMADTMELSVEETEPLVADYTYELGMPDALEQDIADTSEWLQEAGALDDTATFEEVVDTSYLEQLEAD